MHLSIAGLRARRSLAACAGAAVLAAASFTALAQALPHKVGDRVEGEWKSGLWFTAKIIEADGGQYKVRYDSDGVIQSLPSARLRPVGGGARSAPAASQNAAAGKAPVLADGFPVIPGTAWKIDWGIRGGNVQVFLFCESGRWEVVSPMLTAGALTLMGTYKLQGNKLTTKNTNGREVTDYRMSWKSSVLDLDSGKTVMHLHYRGTTACK